MIRRFCIAAVLVCAALAPGTLPASATGVSPDSLANAGWTCFNGPQPFNPRIHCAPPGVWEAALSGDAEMAIFLTFDTEDVGATDAALLGTERMIRADLYHGQRCPTDPPSYEYSHLLPLLGLDYYICHTFDSPW
jgi:hypothetical protein